MRIERSEARSEGEPTVGTLSWSGVPAATVGLLAEPIGAPVNDLLLDMKHAAAGLSYLEWVRFQRAAELHTQLVAPDEANDKRRLDAWRGARPGSRWCIRSPRPPQNVWWTPRSHCGTGYRG